MYKKQLVSLAQNVFEFEDLPEFIDTAFVNETLLMDGQIAFFKDEVMGLIALPFTEFGRKDVYGRPLQIIVQADNGYRRTLNRDEFVIMYDNSGKYSIYNDIIQYSRRLALYTRIMDINVSQQKTCRIWKTSTEHEKSLRAIVNDIDSNVDSIITYNDIDLDDTTVILATAPFVTPQISLEKDKLWNEFLRLIGIANLSYVKKERNIKDEITAMQGGTIASRFSRYEPRERAIKEINEKFGLDIKVRYYDRLPSSDIEDETQDDENIDNEEVDYDE